MKKCGKDASLLATCRSYTFRCSLHIAVLAQKKDIIKYLVKRFTETLHVGDNVSTAVIYCIKNTNAGSHILEKDVFFKNC